MRNTIVFKDALTEQELSEKKEWTICCSGYGEKEVFTTLDLALLEAYEIAKKTLVNTDVYHGCDTDDDFIEYRVYHRSGVIYDENTGLPYAEIRTGEK